MENKTTKISDNLRLASVNYAMAHTYSNLPFMCRKNSTSDKYTRRGNENMTMVLFLLFQ